MRLIYNFKVIESFNEQYMKYNIVHSYIHVARHVYAILYIEYINVYK